MVKLRRVFESDLYLESKKDLDDLKFYLGDTLFDDYMKIRDRIPSVSDLNKKYPDFSDTDWDKEIEKQFVKKYNTLIKDRIVHDSKEFKDAPSLERISSNNIKRYLSLYSKMRDFVLDMYSKYRDFSKLKKQNKGDVQDFVSNYISVGDKKRQDKVEGAEKLYEDSDWEVYRITTYPAAQLYGSGTKWCITGRYPGHEGKGQEYFDEYIEDNDLDGGYYFYLNKEDPSEKYCVLQTEDHKIHSIWDAEDTNRGSSLKDLNVDLPKVPEVNLSKFGDSDISRILFVGDSEDLKNLVENGVDLVHFEVNDPMYGYGSATDIVSNSYTPDTSSIFWDKIKYLISLGCDYPFLNNNTLRKMIMEGSLQDFKNLNDVKVDLSKKNLDRNFSIIDILYKKKSNDKDILQKIQYLLSMGVNPNLPDKCPSLANLLHNQYSDDKVFYNVIKSLLEAGADVNKYSFLPTPLCSAIRKDDLPLVKLLLPYYSNINYNDYYYEMSPLSLAKKRGNAEIIDLLEKYGATE